jgi:hypothetical protein
MMEGNLKTLGIVSILVGVTTTILCFFSLKLALPLSILGMMASGIYVFIDTKNQVNNTTITPGIIGMILSSVPVLFVLFMIAYQYFKHS